MLLLLIACPTPPDCPVRYIDLDGDGYGSPDGAQALCPGDEGAGLVDNDLDCDDSDPAVNPDAEESCASPADEDCDGLSSHAPDAPLSYADEDGDGFGAGDPLMACGPPEGAVDRDGDCDDSRAEVNPDAQETCKTRYDDDCDGSTEGGADPLPWYWDEDGDGVGAVKVLACDAPDGAVAQGGDCDDGDSVLTDTVRVSWTSVGDEVSDLTSAWSAGAPSAPVEWVAADSGTLRVCSGIWYVQVVVVGQVVSVQAAGEGAVLSGGTQFAQLLTVGAEAEVQVEGLVFDRARGGSAVLSSGQLDLIETTFTQNLSSGEGPGGLLVLDGEAALVDSLFQGNTGGRGGAIAVTGGLLSTEGTDFIDNVASVSGGALYATAEASLQGGSLHGNEAPAGGALATSSRLKVEDCKVYDNVAGVHGGGAYVTDGGALECVSTGGSFGFWANSAASGGAAYLAAAAPELVHQVRVDSLGCDWTNSQDNDPTDLNMTYSGQSWYFGDNANFGCNGEGCQ